VREKYCLWLISKADKFKNTPYLTGLAKCRKFAIPQLEILCFLFLSIHRTNSCTFSLMLEILLVMELYYM
jgi:hypothetical protein